MTDPRPIHAGTTYLLTRRCFQRTFLLRPSPLINQAFLYCLALAAAKFGVQIHAFCVMSNHYHLVATDVHGRLPEFMHWLNEFVAKCVNQILDRQESVWAPGSYSSVVLEDEEAILDKMSYVFNNPVAAQLVSTGEQWPGLRSRPEDLDRARLTALRPNCFFKKRGRNPAAVDLELCLPPALKHLSREQVVVTLRDRVNSLQEEIRQSMRVNRQPFPGARHVLDQSPFDSPARPSPRNRMNPRIACKNRDRRIEALRRLKSFLVAYREAWREFRRGDPSACFPQGTYLMRWRYNVPCSAVP